MMERQREGGMTDECEQLIRNAELLMDGAKMQLRQARRALRDPSLLADRVERAKASAMDYVLKGLKQISDLDDRVHTQEDV